ncbi:MAG: hypothetical protein AAGC95_06115 [Pseudomonadota bacterium]
MDRGHCRTLKASIAAAFFACGATGESAADMLVSPLRAVLSEQTTRMSVTVMNQSDRLLDVRAQWLELSATEQGGYAPASPQIQGGLSASPYLLVSPDNVRIAPGRQAAFILHLAPEATPPAGERRSHLLIEGAAAATRARKASLADIPLDMKLGVSIPVLLRRGNGDATARIAHAEFSRKPDGGLTLITDIDRDGAFSAYGRLVARWRQTGADEAEIIGVLDNIALYTDIPRRRAGIPLIRSDVDGGRLELAYEGAGEYAGRNFDAEAYDIEPREAP